jgi:DNA mismatch endonuclease (patch repair protein)
MDTLSKTRRSWNMSRIRSKHTQPERIVRSLLHRMGFRFRLHRRDLPGCPDIVLPRYRSVVLVHGCFWHRHKGCKYAYSPKSRTRFWLRKFQENVARDRLCRSRLGRLRWRPLVVWECELENPARLAARLRRFLSKERPRSPRTPTTGRTRTEGA